MSVPQGFAHLLGGSRKLQAKCCWFHSLHWHTLIPLLVMVAALYPLSISVSASEWSRVSAPKSFSLSLVRWWRGGKLKGGIVPSIFQQSTRNQTTQASARAAFPLGTFARLSQADSIDLKERKWNRWWHWTENLSVFVSCQVTQYHFHTLPPCS